MPYSLSLWYNPTSVTIRPYTPYVADAAPGLSLTIPPTPTTDLRVDPPTPVPTRPGSAPPPIQVTRPSFQDYPGSLFSNYTLQLVVPPRPFLPPIAPPGAAPTFSAPTVPALTPLAIPPAPVFSPIQMPTDIGILPMPTFDEVTLSLTLAEPNTTFSYGELGYSSALLNRIQIDITAGLNSTDSIDDAIWERARARERTVGDSIVQGVAHRTSTIGQHTPVSARVATQRASSQSARKVQAALDRSIKLKQNELAVANRVSAIGRATTYEQMIQGFHSKERARALAAAIAKANYAVQLYNARVEYFKTQSELYKTSALIYESKIRAARAVLDIYKARMEATTATVRMQKTRAELYRAQLNGVQSMVDVYKIQVEGARATASIEQMKLDGYRATIEAYVAQVKAKSAEVQMYESAVRGETAKAELFEAQVGVYRKVVEGHKVWIQTNDAWLKATVENGALDVARRKAEAAKLAVISLGSQYTSKIDARRAQLDAQLAGAQIDLDSTRNIIANSEVIARGRLALSGATAYKDYAVSAMRLNAQIMALASQEVTSKTRIVSGEVIHSAQTLSSALIARGHTRASESIAVANNASAAAIAAGNIATNTAIASALNTSNAAIAAGNIASSTAIGAAQNAVAASIAAGGIATNAAVSSNTLATNAAISAGNIHTSALVSAANIAANTAISSATIATSGAVAAGGVAADATIALGQMAVNEAVAAGNISLNAAVSAATIASNASISQGNIRTNAAISGSNITAQASQGEASNVSARGIAAGNLLTTTMIARTNSATARNNAIWTARINGDTALAQIQNAYQQTISGYDNALITAGSTNVVGRIHALTAMRIREADALADTELGVLEIVSRTAKK